MTARMGRQLGHGTNKPGERAYLLPGAAQSILDLKGASNDSSHQVRNWRVMDEDTLSPHKYLSFGINLRGGRRPSEFRGWNTAKLNREAMERSLRNQLETPERPIDAEEIQRVLENACDQAMPRSRKHKHPPAYW